MHKMIPADGYQSNSSQHNSQKMIMQAAWWLNFRGSFQYKVSFHVYYSYHKDNMVVKLSATAFYVSTVLSQLKDLPPKHTTRLKTSHKIT